MLEKIHTLWDALSELRLCYDLALAVDDFAVAAQVSQEINEVKAKLDELEEEVEYYFY